LILCFSTLIICVWSALHFDIPRRRHRKRDGLAFGALWMIIATLCPEGLLAAAIHQHIDASMLEAYASVYLPSRTQANPGWLTRVLKRRLVNRGVSSSIPL
jgi:hypothetical protein